MLYIEGVSIYGCVGAMYRPAFLENLKIVLCPSWKIFFFFVISTNTLQFKMVCKKEVNFMEKLVAWGILKCVAIFLGFCKIGRHNYVRKNNKEFTCSLFTRSNSLCRIDFCFRKKSLCHYLFPQRQDTGILPPVSRVL